MKALEEKNIEGGVKKDISPEADVNNKLPPSPNKDIASKGSREGMKTNVGVEKTKEEKEAMIKKIFFGIFAVCIFFGGKAACESIDFSSSSNSSGLDVSTTSSKSSNSQEEEILLEMTRIREEIKSVLPKVENLYNAHQQHMAQGLPYASSPAWGKWQDCNKRIDDLWNEYINLARKLDDNDAIINEAQESKRTMDQTIMDMFGAHY